MLGFITNIRLILIVAAIIAAPSLYLYGRYDAMKACDNRHKIAGLEKTIERKTQYEKINKKLPYSSDRNTKFEWLLDNVYQ